MQNIDKNHPAFQEEWNRRVVRGTAFTSGFHATKLAELYRTPFDVPIAPNVHIGEWFEAYFDKEAFGALELKGKILDIGCGWGWMERHFATVPEVICWGVDVSDITVSILVQQFARHKNIQFAVTDGSGDLSIFPDKMFDIIVSKSVFYHIPDEVVEKYFEEMARVLKEDGKFLIQTVSELSVQTNIVAIKDEKIKEICAKNNLECSFIPVKVERASYSCISGRAI
jgi:SAM-dependent methyltransferase